jgi:16S rRNA (cytosine967-C5)-methyltransferase
MRSEQQLRTFFKVLDTYPGDRPITKFLPDFFKKNKQMGSTDRRSASRLLYNYFRLGRALSDKTIEQRLFLAEFLCCSVDNPFLQHFRPDFNDKIYFSLDEKIKYAEVNEGLVLTDIFPFTSHLSDGIDKKQFLSSLFIQPDLFIRINPPALSIVLKIILDSGIEYKQI